MHYITQETHAQHYTGNTCTILHKLHMHFITQVTGLLLYITKEAHATNYTANTCTTFHRKHMLYITQETKKTHALHYIKNKHAGDTCSTLHRNHMHYITPETHALQNS